MSRKLTSAQKESLESKAHPAVKEHFAKKAIEAWSATPYGQQGEDFTFSFLHAGLRVTQTASTMDTRTTVAILGKIGLRRPRRGKTTIVKCLLIDALSKAPHQTISGVRMSKVAFTK